MLSLKCAENNSSGFLDYLFGGLLYYGCPVSLVTVLNALCLLGIELDHNYLFMNFEYLPFTVFFLSYSIYFVQSSAYLLVKVASCYSSMISFHL